MPDAQRHDCAVALCCDRTYFRLALFVCHQIAHHNPGRRFDLVILTRDALEVPAWARPLGILIQAAEAPPAEAGPLTQSYLSEATFYRLALPRILGGRYRRILYLDCDIFVEGGDFGRLLDIDLGPHAIGMVLDGPNMMDPNHLAREYRITGLARAPYANAGVQLIDTRAYQDQDIEARAFAAARRYPGAIPYADQSLLNLALQGRFAELSPAWNWQVHRRLPLMTHCFPVFLRHFVGSKKPDRHSGREMEARFALAYRDHLSKVDPEAVATLAPLCPPTPLTFRELVALGRSHLLARSAAAAAIARHPDPYRAIL
jgi:lipopolysaccharide biosynthesis glycosyltransferase